MEEKKELIKIIISELEARGYIKKENTSFKNTERLLFSYNKLKESINDRKEQIKDLKEVGLPKKSKSITNMISGNFQNKDTSEVLEDSIKSISKHIDRTKIILKHIDRTLEKFIL